MGIPVVVPLGVVPQRGEGEGVHAALGCCLLIDFLADGGTCLFCLYLYASGVSNITLKFNVLKRLNRNIFLFIAGQSRILESK